jgi:hypothetical protein
VHVLLLEKEGLHTVLYLLVDLVRNRQHLRLTLLLLLTLVLVLHYNSQYPDLVTDVHLTHAQVQLLLLLIQKVNVRLLQLQNRAGKKSVGLPYVSRLNPEAELESSVCLRQSDHGLELSDSDSV